MMETKLSVTFVLPGRTMETQVAPANSKTIKIKIKKGYKKKKVLTERTFIPAKQVINMSEIAYKAMIENCANNKFNKIWNTMSKNERIKQHLNLIAHDLGAISFTFEVLQ